MYIKVIILFTYIIALLHNTNGSVSGRIKKSLERVKSGFNLGDRYNEFKSNSISNPLPKSVHISSVSNSPRIVTSSKKEGKQIDNTPIVLRPMKGFYNWNVACYANSLIQSLINIKMVRERVLASPLCLLKKVFTDYYDDTIGILDLTDLRIQHFGKELLYTQQNPAEFLSHLLKHPDTSYLQGLCVYHNVTKRFCGCPSQSVEEFKIRLVTLPLFYPATIQRLISNNLMALWETIQGSKCSDCNKQLRQQTVYEDFGPILIFVLQLAKLNQIAPKITNFELNGVAHDDIVVGTKKYELSAGIFHEGNDLKSGHYTAIVKKGGLFFKADDKTIKECDWPETSKDLYMLFYVEKPSM